MPRPTNATLRPNRTARFTRICIRWMLVANAATTILPAAAVKISSNAFTTSSSDPVTPVRSTFVLSANSASTPALSQLGESMKVESLAVEGRLIDLEVTGVNDDSPRVYAARSPRNPTHYG